MRLVSMEILLIGRIINHVLLFSPLKLRLVDVLNIARSCWKYGEVHQDYEGVSMGAVNYCAKHQVKSCAGSVYQKTYAPLIRSVSNYCGSLGSDMVDNDEYYQRWMHVDPSTDEPDLRYLDVIQGSISYKVRFPEAYHRKFWERYCRELNRDRLKTDFELEKLQKKSYEKFLLEFEKFVSSRRDIQELDFDAQLDMYYTFYHKKDYEQRMNYERLRLSKKRSELMTKYFNHKKDIPYEHF